MAETISHFDVRSEAELNYYDSIRVYIAARAHELISGLNNAENVQPPQTQFNDLINFLSLVARGAPIYLIEQFAPHSHSYSSLRGAGYSCMGLALAKRYLFHKGSISAVNLNHEFRCSANALDAAVDENKSVIDRHSLKKSLTSQGFKRSKAVFYDGLRSGGKHFGEMYYQALGTTARRYQMHQDLYLDLARMRKGISETRYLKDLPQLPMEFPFTREQLAHLVVLGLDGETLLIDSIVLVNPAISFNIQARNAAFWGAITGTLGDQRADLLQDLCTESDNMFATFLNLYPEESLRINKLLNPMLTVARELLEHPTLEDKISFFRLQIELNQLFQEKAPQILDKYVSLTCQAFSQIPLEFQADLIPIRFASWDLMSLYQLTDFVLHIDKYEEQARNEGRRVLAVAKSG